MQEVNPSQESPAIGHRTELFALPANETRLLLSEEFLVETDFGRFVEIGTGSVFELISQSFVARRQNFLSEENFQTIYSNADEIGRMLSGRRASLERR